MRRQAGGWRREGVAGLHWLRCGTVFVMILFTGNLAVGQDPQLRVFDEVGFDQKLNNQVPLNLEFQDSAGRTVRLGEYFGDKPVILSLVYFQCPRLCTLELNGLVNTLRTLKYTAGDEFELVTISFDPRETPELAADKKKIYLRQYGRPDAEDGWHFLTGQEQEIRMVCDSVGFRYMWDEDRGQYGHASGIIVLTPNGKVSRYFFGIEYPPRDVQLGIVESSNGKIGSPVDKLVLLCYGYDPATGKYGFIIMNGIRLAGLATVVGLVAFVSVMVMRERRAQWRTAAQTTA